MQAANTYMMRCSRLQFVILTVRRVVLRVRRPLQIGLFVCKHQASLQPEESCLPFARPASALDAEHRATTLLKQLHEAKAAARFSDLNWRCCIWRLGVVLGCLICVGERVAVVLTCWMGSVFAVRCHSCRKHPTPGFAEHAGAAATFIIGSCPGYQTQISISLLLPLPPHAIVANCIAPVAVRGGDSDRGPL